MLTCVIPALNAEAHLPGTLASLGGHPDEIIVADGGSRDATAAMAREHGATVIAATRGRGSQLAAGIAASRGDWLLLLHADTTLSSRWPDAARHFMSVDDRRAGYFRFRVDAENPRARRLERLVAWRCRTFALPYGDQGLLVSRKLLDEVGGMRPLALMEDVDLVRRLGGRRLAALDADAVTAAEKWEREGYFVRSARNLFCLSLYFAGLPPAAIAKVYG